MLENIIVSINAMRLLFKCRNCKLCERFWKIRFSSFLKEMESQKVIFQHKEIDFIIGRLVRGLQQPAYTLLYLSMNCPLDVLYTHPTSST